MLQVALRARRRIGVRGHAKARARVAAYYWWVFPNLMLNFYPWGMSVNLVLPEAIDRTRVAFRSYVWDASKLDAGAGGALDRVEAEDEAIVEAVQRGVRSRFYAAGATRRRASKACTISTGCSASSLNDAGVPLSDSRM